MRQIISHCYEVSLKLETMQVQKIDPREFLQKASVIITKCGSFWYYK